MQHLVCVLGKDGVLDSEYMYLFSSSAKETLPILIKSVCNRQVFIHTFLSFFIVKIFLST